MSTKIYDYFESVWERHSIAISVVGAIIIGFLYSKGYIKNVRSVTGNIITFASIIIATNGVFLSLIITLKESPAFRRLRELIPSFEQKIFTVLRNQIIYALLVVLISIVINVLPPSPSLWFSAIGISIWFVFFLLMSVGSFVSVKLVTDIVLKNFNIPSRSSRQ